MTTVQLRRMAWLNPATPEFLSTTEDVTFVPLEAVWPNGRADFSRRADVSDVASGYTRFRAGDVLQPKVTPTFAHGRSTVAAIDTPVGAASTEVHVLRAKSHACARYLAYVGQSRPFISEGMTRVEGVGNLLRVPPEFVAQYRLPLMSRTEQEEIADFLDRETAQIDAMIEAQERVVHLSQEHRAAVVAQTLEAVETEGAPTVPLRYCLMVQSGVTLGNKPSEDYEEYPYLRVANVQTGWLDLNVIKTVRVAPDVARRAMLRTGDVLITEGGDRTALGRGALWRGEIPGALHQNHIFALRCRDCLDPSFLVYVLDAPAARIHFESTRRQTTNLSSTNTAKVKAFKTPLPPVTRQKEIVAELDGALERVNEVIAAAQRVTILLRERREALITAAVSGRIDPITGIERIEEAS